MPSKVSSACGKRWLRNSGSSELVLADVAIDVLRQFLDLELAAEPLAEEGDVVSDDRTNVEQRRLRMRAERRQELL